MKKSIHIVMEVGYMELNATPVSAFFEERKANCRKTNMSRGHAGGQQCNRYFIKTIVIEDAP